MIAKVADLARATPEVVECLRITGEDCFIMRIHVRDVEHLEELIDAFVLYGQTTTLDRPVRGRAAARGAGALTVAPGSGTRFCVAG
jgi:Lrp/AsnC family leucine-responsive transcriptional regulator